MGSCMTYSKIAGTGRYLPERVLTNFDLEKIVETSDEWIRTRTGVERRHVCADDETTSDMCVEAAKVAIEDAGIDVSDIDFVIVGTTTPDLIFPNIATLIQHRLGIPACTAFSLEAACTGFIYALTTTDKFIKAGGTKCALVIGAECITKLVDWKDRNTCVLFGDGAGAIVVGASSDGNRGILSTRLRTDGSYAKTLYVPAGGSLKPASIETIESKQHTITMNGKEVFKIAVRAMEEISREVLEEANVSIDEVSLVIPHQANRRIINALAERLKVPLEKVVVNVDKYGNTSAASVPVALDEAWRQGRIAAGDTVLLNSFGAGFAWGAALIRF